MSLHIQLAPNDFVFPFLSSLPSFTNHRYSTLIQKTQKQKQNGHFRILSAAHQDTTPATIPTTTTARKHLAIYLKERLGFSEELSLTISKKLLHLRDLKSTRGYQVTDLISFEKADNVIAFLQQHCGLAHSQIEKLITKYPTILGSDVDKTIKPKVKLLQELGFSTSDLAHVLSANPRLYLERDLSSAIQALRGFLGNDEDVVKFCKRLTYGSSSNILSNLIPNVNMLEIEYGIPRDKILKFVTKSPHSFMGRTEWLRDVLVRMEDKWGITRDSAVFLPALHVFCCHSDEKINSKCQVFRNYGWSDSDILTMIRRQPNCVGLSEARIKKKLDFYMNELDYEPAYVASRPVMLGLSLENRVVPRHRVLTVLKEKGLIKVDYQLFSAVIFTENVFLNNFIIPYESIVPNLRQVLVNSKAPCEAMLGGKTYEDEAHQ